MGGESMNGDYCKLGAELSNMDIIFIRKLLLETAIGVHQWEREQRRVLRLDLELGTDIRAAAASDDLRQTVDYQALADAVRSLVAQREVQLLETLAEEIATLVLQQFPVRWLRLRLQKPGVPSGAAAAGIIIERHATHG